MFKCQMSDVQVWLLFRRESVWYGEFAVGTLEIIYIDISAISVHDDMQLKLIKNVSFFTLLRLWKAIRLSVLLGLILIP